MDGSPAAVSGGVRKARRPCATPGCPGLVEHERYCPACQAMVDQRDRERRGSAAQRGYNANWRRLRRMMLSEQPLCADPFGVHGEDVVLATEVDHVIPRRCGGATTWDNVVAACSPCNLRKGGLLPAQAKMWPLQKPYQPTVQDLHNNGRLFPPNYLHESWMDYLYWDVELEP